jgi:hypothetical protein
VPTGTRRCSTFTVTRRKSLPLQLLKRLAFQASVPEFRLQTGPDGASGLPDSYSAFSKDTARQPPASPQEGGGPKSSRRDMALAGVDVEAGHPGREVLP